ncbi:glutamine--fructose-6-phosphate transaminase (isomerizing), partial [Candidatus Poribacteria bacterium]|nr:glutamine--fructose-6-phosphate transaminase (isomerizing) [Candidatus Poribacteria bacterium]
GKSAANSSPGLLGSGLASPPAEGSSSPPAAENEFFVASDVPAILEHTNEVIYLEDGEIADISREGVRISTFDGKSVQRSATKVTWDMSQVQKEGYPHFMIKEIMEQPQSLEQTIAGRIQCGVDSEPVTFQELEPLREKLSHPQKVNRIVILGCGTAYHAGLVGKAFIEKSVQLPVTVDMSSEFRYNSSVVTPETLVIAMSQSGETADTLAGVRHAKAHGATVIAICNVVGSSITREVDVTVYTHAGPEIAVASTKAYTAQLAVLSLLSLYLGGLRRPHLTDDSKKFLQEIECLPQLVEKVLVQSAFLQDMAIRYSKFDRFLYLGRYINYPSALEGALKLKEISYIHAEGYPAGEMKHGHIALIDDEMPVLCIVTQSSVYEKMISNLQEVDARGGRVIAIATEGDTEIGNLIQDGVYLPPVHEFVSPILVAVALQLFAYYVAVHRGLDVDQPRNLAKSVTVE